jgi:hypothetical protein
MLFSEENNHLFSIYSNLLSENPDTIYYGGKSYSYDDDIGNYTGFMNDKGQYVMTKEADGHNILLRYIKSGDIKKLKPVHNLGSDEEVIRAFRLGGFQFRLWPKFQIFSIWNSTLDPIYNDAVDAILGAVAGGEGYVFDNNVYGDDADYIPYDEFIKDELSDDEKDRVSREAREKENNKRRLADYELGNKPRRASADYDIEPKQKFYRRDGD